MYRFDSDLGQALYFSVKAANESFFELMEHRKSDNSTSCIV